MAWTPRPELGGKCQNLQIKKEDESMTSIGLNLDGTTKEAFSLFLKEKANVFAGKPVDMLSIDPNFFCHKLIVNPLVKPVCQRRRKMTLECLEEIERQVKELLRKLKGKSTLQRNLSYDLAGQDHPS